MKVALCLHREPHGHSYGADFLFDGLCQVLGFENVLDWPEVDHLHLAPDDPGDACQIDSDQHWPRKGHAWEDVCSADLAIVCGGEPGDLVGLPASLPVVAVDFTDIISDQTGRFTNILGGRPPRLMFKREIPIGLSAYAAMYPAPLMYPDTRFTPVFEAKATRVFYHATSHGFLPESLPPDIVAPIWSGLPRYHIVEGLVAALPAEQRDVGLHAGMEGRLDRATYHGGMLDALVGVSWNTGPNWATYDCNRLWEGFACGMAQVIERPRIVLPHPPVDGVHCVFADSPDDVVTAVVALLRDREDALRMAREGHEWFRRYHSARARAQYILDICARVLGEDKTNAPR